MLSTSFRPFAAPQSFLGAPGGFTSPCITRAKDFRPEDANKECGFCFRNETCDPGLVCHCGVCRKPADPDVRCERSGFIWDYENGACTDQTGPNPCDAVNAGAAGIANAGAGEDGGTQPLSDASKGVEAATIVVGLTTLAGNVGGGIYANRAKGGFWWTLLGILVGGMAGNLTGRLVTLPLR